MDSLATKPTPAETTTTTPAASAPAPHTSEALLFDQVNANPDELVELRGEGRYFGVTDPELGTTINAQQLLGPLCGNCHRRGHVRAKCKTVVCHKCGVIGDHYELQCPTTMICARCGVKGHRAAECTLKYAKKKQYCLACDLFKHGESECPLIWRSYLTDSKVVPTTLPPLLCYNCGSNTHYGDECTRERLLRVPNFGLAFSGNNLPRSLRDKYYDSARALGRGRDYNSNSHAPPVKPVSFDSYRKNGGNGSRNFNQGRNTGSRYGNYNSKPTPSRSGTIGRPGQGARNGPLRLGVIKRNGGGSHKIKY